MGIVYLISVIVLLIAFLLVRKTQNKLNMMIWIPLSMLLFFCYNAFITYFLNLFGIPIILQSMSSINIILAILMLLYSLRKREIQKYEIYKQDIIQVILLAVLVAFIGYQRFGFPMKITYETADAVVHAKVAFNFAKSDALNNTYKDQIFGSGVFKTGSYVNSGMIMKCFEGVIDPIDNYIIFEIFDLFVLFLTGWLFYASLLKFSKSKGTTLLAFIVSALCICGYPLNSMLFGFTYLSMVLAIFPAIILMIQYWQEEGLAKKGMIAILAFLTFGLFSSYFNFVPFTYAALFVFFCIDHYRKNHKIISKKLVFTIVFILIIPFLLGYLYYFETDLYEAIEIHFNSDVQKKSITLDGIEKIGGVKFDGYIYKNLYSSILLLVPLTIYALAKEKKKITAEAILLGANIAYIGVYIIGYIFGFVSQYFIAKNYFTLWILLFYYTYQGLMYLHAKEKVVPYLCVGSYVIILFIYLLVVPTEAENFKVNYYERPWKVMEIFGNNKTIMTEKEEDYTKEEIEFLKQTKSIIDYSKQVEFVANREQSNWTYALLDYINKEPMMDKYTRGDKINAKISLLPEKVNKVDYMVYFKKSIPYIILKEKMFEKGTIIYENEAGGIIQYRNKD